MRSLPLRRSPPAERAPHVPGGVAVVEVLDGGGPGRGRGGGRGRGPPLAHRDRHRLVGGYGEMPLAVG